MFCSVRKKEVVHRTVAGLLFLMLSMLGATQNLSGKVDSLFRHIKPNEPGYVVGIIKDGRLIYSKGFGAASLEHKTPMTPASKFYIASMSKQFTAACALYLVENGQLHLDEDIRTYLPELYNYGTKITASHLLHHTSGIREYSSLLLQSGFDTGWEYLYDNDKAFALIARQKELNFPPGERFLYSSSNYILLTRIIERISGTSLRKFADSVLFKPLGMTSTFFSDDHSEVIPGRVESYRLENNVYSRYIKAFEVVGDGGIITTLEDLARWDAAFYNGLPGISGFAEKMTRAATLNNGHPVNYAWGLYNSNFRGHPATEHGGFMINFDSDFLRFPDQHLSVIVFSNCWTGWQGGSTNLAYTIAGIFLPPESRENFTPEKNTPAVIPKLPGALIQQYAGYYWNRDENYYNIIEMQGDSLFYNNTDGWRPYMIPVTATTFRPEGTEITIEFTKEGMKMTDMTANTPVQQFRKYDAASPVSITEFERYRGNYYSGELETTYTFSIRDGGFYLRINHNAPRLVFPSLPNKVRNRPEMLWIGFAEVMFVNDENGRVKGFRVGDMRVKGVFFEKMESE